MPDLTGKTILITGANTGIGKEAARSLAGMQATLVLACRNQAKAEAARAEIAQETGNPNISVILVDFTSLASVRQFAAEFLKTHSRLDVLMNNAGIMRAKKETTPDGFEALLQVNFLAPFLLTNRLLDLLKQSAPSRIVTVSSSMESSGHIDLDDLNLDHHPYSGFPAYGRTKQALILFTKLLAERLTGTGVTANTLHPGIALTQLAEQIPAAARLALRFTAKTPREISETQVYLASSPEVEGVSGEYFIDCKPVQPSAGSQDMELAERLWEKASQFVGLTP